MSSSDKKEEEDKSINFEISRNMDIWLNNQLCSIVCTSYKTNLVFTFGKFGNKINVWYSQFNRPMELYVDDNIYLGTQVGIVSFINNIDESITKDNVNQVVYDGNYIPNKINFTGDIDIHDIYKLNSGLYFVSSQLNSICVINNSTKYNFDIFWTPSFISKKNNRVPKEDRCHLNSCCPVNGKIKYACMVSDSDISGGWRDNRVGGGLIIDIDTDEVVCSNLCMPHSLQYYYGKLYVLDSGTGRFGYINFEEEDTSKRFKEICFIPGFLRGLKFINNYAVIGMSMDRHENIFSGLPLCDKMKEKKINPKCGIKIVNINTGDIEHSIELINVIEIYGIGIIQNNVTSRLMDLNNDMLVNAIKY